MLARDAALGDRDAFEALVELVGPGLLRYARRMLRDDGEAEDCTQETLVAAWLGLDRFRGEASARTWMFGIQANMVRRRLRRPPAVPVDTSVVEPEPLTDVAVEHSVAGALRVDLDRALAELPSAQRAAWLLVAVEGLSYDEAARAQSTTVAALRGRLERARATLGRRLAAWA